MPKFREKAIQKLARLKFALAPLFDAAALPPAQPAAATSETAKRTAKNTRTVMPPEKNVNLDRKYRFHEGLPVPDGQ